MKHITLILPGLMWPAHSAAAVAQDLALPALSSLLGSGRLTRQPATNAEGCLLALFQLDPKRTARARLRALGDGLDDDGIFCADPVPLVFGRDALMLGAPESLAVSMDEAACLIDALNQHFADIGHFCAPHPQRVYLRLTAASRALLDGGVAPLTTHLGDVVGRRIDNYLPTHPTLRRWMNEIQMLLHSHPVNARRLETGQPAINSLWLWGDGELAPAQLPGTALWADDPFARGLAKWAGTPNSPLPPAYRKPDAPHTLALVQCAHTPFLEQNIDAWRDALQTLEAQWFAPALAEVKKGALLLTLILPGDQVSLKIECRKPRLWGLFTKPVQIGHFLATFNLP